jgi:methylthioribose-1-phosphate isomerase
MAKIGNFKLIWGYPEENFSKEHAQDKDILLCEMRPSLLGARFLTKKFKNATLASDNTLGFLFFKRLIKEVVLFYQDQDNFGYALMPGSFTVIILAKRHNVPIRLLRGNPSVSIKLTDINALSFLGQSITAKGVIPIIPEIEFGDYKFIEGRL